ncbi:Pimeloyl-ACP methyl ester carboxylesterase [Arachidicoccus rhizosphaerae]|uniref:Pimeloyl-ACP methyl ester carboxylesterase n=1 Tax=Arachidicoccus rhizosphaerae TaxID=551991 RepID=A0A1H3W9Z7_9BACT|nr:alpha/beta hydrolase [Arachidicoccus rhizosphaerae]SDZ83671.1 Pimeloyl-ACP methyl ester carboxylesterase [Arachidicoccus rhizosphaerae]
MVQQRLFEFEKASICYYRYGSGPQLAFCLHGYSNSATMFELLAPRLGDSFTLIALDLPYHGQTRWGRHKMRVEELDAILQGILKQEQLAKAYMLVGFSLGARICISLFNFNPEPVQKMILLSADGLYSSFLYKLLVRTRLGHFLMAWLLKNPKKSMPTVNWLYHNKLINKTIYTYARSFVNSKRQSTLLYARWVSMSRLHPGLKRFQRQLSNRKIPVLMVFGKKDQVTPLHNAEIIRKYQNTYLHIYKWEAGHLLLRPQYLDKLVGLFLDCYPVNLPKK